MTFCAPAFYFCLAALTSQFPHLPSRCLVTPVINPGSRLAIAVVRLDVIDLQVKITTPYQIPNLARKCKQLGAHFRHARFLPIFKLTPLQRLFDEQAIDYQYHHASLVIAKALAQVFVLNALYDRTTSRDQLCFMRL
jgi:hypothetical protein